MVRPRHEARDRHHERRRDFRKRFLEELRRRFERRFRRRFRSSLRRHEEDVRRAFETLKLLRDIVMRRAHVAYKVEHVYFFRNKTVVYTYDRLLMSLPEDMRSIVVSVLQSVSEGKGVDPRLYVHYPWIKAFLRFFIAYYGKYPCKHNVYAVKVTPVTIHLFRGYRVTYYFLRWARAEHVKADPFIGRSRPVDFYVSFLRYKYDVDLINSMMVADEGSMSWDDKVTVIRNDRRESEMSIPLRRAILQPHWVKYYLAKMVGKPEIATMIGHCSAYAVLTRPSKTLRLYAARNRRLYGTRPRHRIKEILYRSGLRV